MTSVDGLDRKCSGLYNNVEISFKKNVHTSFFFQVRKSVRTTTNLVTMKKNIVKISVVLMVILGAPTLGMSSNDGVKKATTTKTEMTNTSTVLMERLREIKKMDIAAMDREEKKALRNEVKSIKKEMKRQGGGIYISVGAAIIIVLLLIIIL